MCVCECLHACMCICISGALRGQMIVLDPLELNRWIVVSYHVGTGGWTWVLCRNKNCSSAWMHFCNPNTEHSWCLLYMEPTDPLYTFLLDKVSVSNCLHILPWIPSFIFQWTTNIPCVHTFASVQTLSHKTIHRTRVPVLNNGVIRGSLPMQKCSPLSPTHPHATMICFCYPLLRVSRPPFKDLSVLLVAACLNTSLLMVCPVCLLTCWQTFLLALVLLSTIKITAEIPGQIFWMDICFNSS